MQVSCKTRSLDTQRPTPSLANTSKSIACIDDCDAPYDAVREKEYHGEGGKVNKVVGAKDGIQIRNARQLCKLSRSGDTL